MICKKGFSQSKGFEYVSESRQRGKSNNYANYLLLEVLNTMFLQNF